MRKKVFFKQTGRIAPSVFGALLVILSLSCSFSAHAQASEYETIFSKKANRGVSDFRLYGALNFIGTQVRRNDKADYYSNIGLEVGVTYKRKFAVGVFYNAAFDSPFDYRPGTPFPVLPYTTIGIEQFGLALSYKPKQERAVHAFYNLKMGGVLITRLKTAQNQNLELNSVTALMANPSVGLETNLLPWLAMQASIGYQVVSREEAVGINFQRDLRGFTGQIGLVFGRLR